MIFKDELCVNDTIEASHDKKLHGNSVKIEIQDGGATGVVYLTKEDARNLGLHLIALSEKI